MTTERTLEITLTVTLPEGHPGFDDPEWVADAAWGALSNEYGLDATYSFREVDNPAS